MEIIKVENITKSYKISKDVGTKSFSSILSLFHREYDRKIALADISFSIEKGDIVGYIGANGSGKSTTIKLLTGILKPDTGRIAVNNLDPFENRRKNASLIGAVFGQKNQLDWDLPVIDSFEISKSIYKISNERYKQNLDHLIEIFEISDIIHQPARQLSLGQRIKSNIALVLLHDPQILYLDEPTIGLDASSKRTLRENILRINKENSTTIFLTSHDMEDIETIAKRIILIDKGKMLFDGLLPEFLDKFSDHYIIQLEFEKTGINFLNDDMFELISEKENMVNIKVSSSIDSAIAVKFLLDKYNPKNIFIRKQNIEDILIKNFKPLY